MSHDIESSQPPPRQKPLIIAITGFGNEAMTSKMRGLRIAIALVERRTAGELADVGAGDERLLTRAGDDDGADGVVSFDFGQGGQQVDPHLLVQRIELVGAMDGENGDAAFAGWRVRSGACCSSMGVSGLPAAPLLQAGPVRE